jgi:hypothetical protein
MEIASRGLKGIWPNEVFSFLPSHHVFLAGVVKNGDKK